jgi:hypothetical protein
MTDDDFPIEASTKVAALLERYPQLESVLIELAPPFEKLRNPVLRKSVAKVASLRQAAAVARMPVNEIVNKLRAVVGQPPVGTDDATAEVSYLGEQPEWFDPTKVVRSFDETESLDDDPMPLVTLLQAANKLQPAEIVELKTTFLPAPGIDAMRKKGFLVWTHEPEPGVFRSYFSKLE